MKVDYGELRHFCAASSVMTPFVLTPSGSCRKRAYECGCSRIPAPRWESATVLTGPLFEGN